MDSGISHLTPRQLFRMLDAKQITSGEFRAAMGLHAQQIITEMEEVKRNPFATWIETMRNRRAAARLVHRHGEPIVRELFVALADVPGFPLANWLWNADCPHMPMHCFLRSSFEPVFRVVQIVSASMKWTIIVEHGKAGRGKGTREKFVFTRDRFSRLMLLAHD